MNTMLLLALLGLLLFVASLLIGSALLGAPNLARRLGRKIPQKNMRKSGWRTYLQRSERVIKPLGGLVPRSPEEMSRQERRLVRAGIRRKDGPILLYGAKVLMAILIAIAFIVTNLMWSNPILYVVLSIFFGALLPDLWLTRRIGLRNDRIQLALPNALDLTVVCVEAGMGLDQALMRIGTEMSRGSPELSDELNILSLEINAGRKRADALRNLGDRTDNKDLKALVAALIQTDRFGTSIAQSLRVFSDAIRSTRRLRAEERAAKMSIKMLPPLVFFIFPAMFIVILGPAVIAVIRNLLPAFGGK